MQESQGDTPAHEPQSLFLRRCYLHLPVCLRNTAGNNPVDRLLGQRCVVAQQHRHHQHPCLACRGLHVHRIDLLQHVRVNTLQRPKDRPDHGAIRADGPACAHSSGAAGRLNRIVDGIPALSVSDFALRPATDEAEPEHRSGISFGAGFQPELLEFEYLLGVRRGRRLDLALPVPLPRSRYTQ